ncbi:MAG: CoA transferase [Bauldia litoralis]
MTDGLFDGVTVLDFTQVIAGPFATMQLALQGADVIKIERPGTGDMMRTLMAAPPFSDHGTSSGFIAYNLSKRSLTLDLKAEAAQEILAPLIERADVVVENFRPGVMAGLGLDAKTLRARRPSLVYCSVTGYGQTGPKSTRPAYDGAIQAESGMMSVTGFPDGGPLRAGYFTVDVPTGYATAFAIASALFKARTTGEGCHIDLAMMDTALSLMGFHINDYYQAGVAPERLGNMSAARMASDNTYTTRDGAIAVVALTKPQIAALAELLGLDGDPTPSEIAAVFETAPTAVWREKLEAAAIPCSIVRELPEALADEQLAGRAIIDHPPAPRGLGDTELTLTGAPFTLSPRAPASRAAPALGENTDEILREAGFDDVRIAAWRDAGVI